MFFFIALIAIAFANEDFKQWAALNKRVYANKAEYLYRLAVFLDNKRFVEANADTELNVFADMTHEEFVKTHLGMDYVAPEASVEVKMDSDFTAPDSMDWRSRMNPVKDQAQCGSCWAFCTIAVLEARANMDNGKLMDLSEQDLVDCDTTDNGCNGGHPSKSFKFVQEKGIALTSTYGKYKAVQGTCNKSAEAAAAFTGFNRVTDGNESKLAELIAMYGPMAIGMDAGQTSFQLYKKGSIYQDSKCRRFMLNHCVTLVGYGSNSQGKYWIVRNSWGQKWGDAGNFLLARGKNNMCGVGRDSTYATGAKAF